MSYLQYLGVNASTVSKFGDKTIITIQGDTKEIITNKFDIIDYFLGECEKVIKQTQEVIILFSTHGKDSEVLGRLTREKEGLGNDYA